MSEATTWVIVLNFNGAQHIEACLDALGRQETPAGGMTVLVADNGSTDGSLEIVERDYPEVAILRHGENLGFAVGNNRAIDHARRAGARYAAILNMDTVAEPNWLARLVEAADAEPAAALLGSLILTDDGTTIEFDGRQFDPVTTSGGYADRPYDGAEHQARPYEAYYACGAAMLIRLEALDRLGGAFDESYFAYHEDVELSLRAHRLGFGVRVVPDSIVRHARGGSGITEERRTFCGTRNMALTLLAHYDRKNWESNRQALAGHFQAHDSPARRVALLSALFAAPAALERRKAMASDPSVLSYDQAVCRDLK